MICSGSALTQYPISDARAIRDSQIFEAGRAKITGGPNVGTLPGGKVTIRVEAVPELSKQNLKRLKVSETDYATYKEFLDTPKSGIFKLITLPECRDTGDNAEIQKCIFESYGISHLANAYSFRARRHNRSIFADLALRKNGLFTSPNFAMSFITNLGNFPISDVSVDSDGVKYMAKFEPSLSADGAKNQATDFNKVITDGKFTYSRGVTILKDITYVMRSSGYKVDKDYPAGPAEDVIVAFRVVRIDDNGDVTIIWKEIHRKKGQKLEIIDK